MDKFFNTIRDNFQVHDIKNIRPYIEATGLYADNNVHLLTRLTNAQIYLKLDEFGGVDGFQVEIAQTVLCNLLTVLNIIFNKVNYIKQNQQTTETPGEVYDCNLEISDDYCALNFSQIIDDGPINCYIDINNWLDNLSKDDIDEILTRNIDFILNSGKEPPRVEFEASMCYPTTYKELYKVIKNFRDYE